MVENSQPEIAPKQGSRNSGLAIASLVCGLLFFIPLASLAAIILGIIALQKIRKEGYDGKGLAIAGIALGSISLILIALFYFGTLIFFSANPDAFLPERCDFQITLQCSEFEAKRSGPNTVEVSFNVTNDMQYQLVELRFNITAYGMNTTKCLSYKNKLDYGDTVHVTCSQVSISDNDLGKFVLGGSYRPREGQFDKRIAGQLYVKIKDS